MEDPTSPWELLDQRQGGHAVDLVCFAHFGTGGIVDVDHSSRHVAGTGTGQQPLAVTEGRGAGDYLPSLLSFDSSHLGSHFDNYDVLTAGVSRLLAAVSAWWICYGVIFWLHDRGWLNTANF